MITTMQRWEQGTRLPAAAVAHRDRVAVLGRDLLPTTPALATGFRIQGTGAPFSGSAAWGPPD